MNIIKTIIFDFDGVIHNTFNFHKGDLYTIISRPNEFLDIVKEINSNL